MNNKLKLEWALILIFLIFSMFLLGETREQTKKIKSQTQSIDSFKHEIILLQDDLQISREEVEILKEMNEDDFDRVNDIEKMDRLLEN